jgi:hypothetical protein
MRSDPRYFLRNLGHRARGWKQELMHAAGIGLLSELGAVHMHGDGRITDYGVLSRRVVTDVGVDFISDGFMGTVEPEIMNFHDAGTGTNAEAVGNTALQTAWGGARVSGTQSQPANGQYRSVATISFTGTFAITEHGLFSASSGGVLFDRSVFSALNVVNGDSIQFTYTVTFSSGG